MVLIARPAWNSPMPTLGIAYLRRTWCNHLFLEFFATHPQVIVRRREQIGGVGDAMLHQIVALAEQLVALCIWGEATDNSNPVGVINNLNVVTNDVAAPRVYFRLRK
jgi:hypothetical protein